MDTLTQAALGATIAEAGFRRRLGGRAVLFGAACGILPDLDMVAGLAGEWASMVHHRGASHSLLVLPPLALLVGWLGHRLIGRGTPRRAWMHLAFWALITHPLLDLCTTYGTQILWPLSSARYALDAIAIIDPLYSLPLLAVLALARWRRFTPASSARLARIALVATTAYVAVGYTLSRRAEAAGRAALARQAFDAEEVRATPLLGTILLWRIVARDAAGDLRIATASSWSPEPESFTALDRPQDPFVSAALDSPRGRIFEWFAMGMVSARVERRQDGVEVHLRDQRYGMLTQPTAGLFGAVARFDQAGHLQSVQRLPDGPAVELRDELRARWQALTAKRPPLSG